MINVGLDVHSGSTVLHALDDKCNTVAREKVKGPIAKTIPHLRRIKEKFNEPLAVCYEASCGYGHVFEMLSQVADRVVPAHPGKLRGIFASHRKNDFEDAKHLALLLTLNSVPAVYVPGEDVREWRRLINHREALIQRRVAVKNQIRALLRTHGIQAPKGLWTKKGIAWLTEVVFPSRTSRLSCDVCMDQLEMDTRQITRVEKELNEIGGKHPGVQLLMTIPGVGIRTAEAVMAWIDEPKRFARLKSVGSYFGMVPCQDQSADKNRLGHITKQGPAVVRRLLTEASWQTIRHSPRMKAFYEQVMRGDPGRRKIALVATGHFLLRIMLSMLQTGEVWRKE
jgi:transposase